MAQRRSFAPDDPFADLDKKMQILERELELQRTAMERLKAMGKRTGRDAHELEPAPARKTA